MKKLLATGACVWALTLSGQTCAQEDAAKESAQPPVEPAMVMMPANAETPPSLALAPPRKPATPTKTSQSAPTWQSLTSPQQQALRPLAGKWHELGADRKRKWLEISKNFHTLTASEQIKMHSRMSEWVALSQQERTQARLNFAATKKLPAEEKAAQWQAYQELSAEEKKKLAAKAAAKPAGVAIVKPAVAAEKLTKVPVTRHTPKSDAPAAAAVPLQTHTLLPQSPIVSTTPATAQP